ncbi:MULTISPECIES: 3-oxoacid CoA-transferase subunit B [unclassified Psychrobacillus]|uniref:3-oxoacid CoA-transferase subunit B n=1 Tax=unclassified Psychrobacillus TaxID=2636677 RepID=UPI001246D7FB|nr:3-oxoacid CoA-transferase subunit B [Psychrobacillus sp. AK 1817]QEY21980.1 3-oxoacid CoA-transferase subunit B [Psychrobacillus sp. AK 1817]QGM32442.1 3-oxoacid CoA-transferase subunit B [Bacillus sp. N3536]
METISSKAKIAKRAAEEIKNGSIVNLGIGIPTLVADYLDTGKEVYLHTENGLLGVGPSPSEKQLDLEIINAGKLPVTAQLGASYFSSSESFAMIRGGHVNTVILGALQISETGDLANWAVPGKDILGVGGAMDLVAGAKEVIITTQHCSKDGEPKIVSECTYPVTAKNIVSTLISEYAVFRFVENKMVLEELADGWTVEKLKEITPAKFIVSPTLSIY